MLQYRVLLISGLVQRCTDSEYLDSYFASGCKVKTPAVGVTPDLRKLIDFYF